MAALVKAAACAGRPLLPVAHTWDVGARRCVRALRRRPVRVVLPSGEVVARKPGPGKEPRTAAPAAGSQAQRPRQRPQMPSEPPPSTWEESGLRYDKAFPGDKRLSSVMTIVKSRPFREKNGKILLEGRRLIADALKAGAVPKAFFFSRLEYVRELPAEKLRGVRLVKVKFDDIKDWSDLVTPQGIMGQWSPGVARVAAASCQGDASPPPVLICDNLRDPGNLGTILRSAAGAGCSKVLLTRGCVDAWDPKVLRAGMGAHFQVPIVNNLAWEAVPNYLPTDTRVHVADNCGIYAQAQMSSQKASDHGWVCDRRYLKFHKFEEAEDGDPGARQAWVPDLEVQNYDVDWTEAPAAVVIGGETHGLSLESLQLAESTGGRRLLIPVVPGVDSLNSAMAASILLFEGKRQLRAREGHLGRDRSYQ
ncbi:rRNA methyltransferase 3, mitochondrial [Echinops telfairi]|uniref:rRNA methyltransferase 3, mitochondrial n=1 Tax=Echinops telfairi TaxID=9371 RepID=A0ABM0ITL6_ECHTE|nr:rRNA methyltransferase 3, mitochondrial [Echinops telfairi]